MNHSHLWILPPFSGMIIMECLPATIKIQKEKDTAAIDRQTDILLMPEGNSSVMQVMHANLIFTA